MYNEQYIIIKCSLFSHILLQRKLVIPQLLFLFAALYPDFLSIASNRIEFLEMLSEIECRRPLQSSHRIPFMGRSNFSIQLFRMGGNAQRCEGMRIQNAHPDLAAS